MQAQCPLCECHSLAYLQCKTPVPALGGCMDEDAAHRLHQLFSKFDQGARQKKGLGFGSAGQSEQARCSHNASAGPAATTTPTFIKSSFVKQGTDDARRHEALLQLKRPQPDAAGSNDHGPSNLHIQQDVYSHQAVGMSGFQPSSRLDAQPIKRARGYTQALAESNSPSQPQTCERRPAAQRGDDADEVAGSDRRHTTARSGAVAARLGGVSGGKHSGPATYQDLIPGYDDMNPLEKLKARTRLALDGKDIKPAGGKATGQRQQQQQQAAEEDNGANGRRWTRYNFDKSAPLDEEGARPLLHGLSAEAGFGDSDGGGGGYLTGEHADDMQELNGLTFRPSALNMQQQALEKRKQAEHDAAMFGAAAGTAPDAGGGRATAAAGEVTVSSDDGQRMKHGGSKIRRGGKGEDRAAPADQAEDSSGTNHRNSAREEANRCSKDAARRSHQDHRSSEDGSRRSKHAGGSSSTHHRDRGSSRHYSPPSATASRSSHRRSSPTCGGNPDSRDAGHRNDSDHSHRHGSRRKEQRHLDSSRHDCRTYVDSDQRPDGGRQHQQDAKTLTGSDGRSHTGRGDRSHAIRADSDRTGGVVHAMQDTHRGKSEVTRVDSNLAQPLLARHAPALIGKRSGSREGNGHDSKLRGSAVADKSDDSRLAAGMGRRSEPWRCVAPLVSSVGATSAGGGVKSTELQTSAGHKHVDTAQAAARRLLGYASDDEDAPVVVGLDAGFDDTQGADGTAEAANGSFGLKATVADDSNISAAVAEQGLASAGQGLATARVATGMLADNVTQPKLSWRERAKASRA